MPAIPIFLQILIGALFAPGVLKNLLSVFGISLNPSDVKNGVSAGPVAQAVPPTTPGAAPAPAVNPTAKMIASDAVKNPVSLFGIAAVGFVAVFVIAQLRAGGHEAVETTKDLYNEGGKATRSLANADKTTGNQSRRAKG